MRRSVQQLRAIFAKLRALGLLTSHETRGTPTYREIEITKPERKPGGFSKVFGKPSKAGQFGENALMSPRIKRVLEHVFGGPLYHLRRGGDDDRRPMDFVAGDWAVEVKSHHYSNTSFEAKIHVSGSETGGKGRKGEEASMLRKMEWLKPDTSDPQSMARYRRTREQDVLSLVRRYGMTDAAARKTLDRAKRFTTISLVHNGVHADVYVHPGGTKAKNASPSTSKYMGTINTSTGAFQNQHRLVLDVHRVRKTAKRSRRVRVVTIQGA